MTAVGSAPSPPASIPHAHRSAHQQAAAGYSGTEGPSPAAVVVPVVGGQARTPKLLAQLGAGRAQGGGGGGGRRCSATTQGDNTHASEGMTKGAGWWGRGQGWHVTGKGGEGCVFLPACVKEGRTQAGPPGCWGWASPHRWRPGWGRHTGDSSPHCAASAHGSQTGGGRGGGGVRAWDVRWAAWLSGFAPKRRRWIQKKKDEKRSGTGCPDPDPLTQYSIMHWLSWSPNSAQLQDADVCDPVHWDLSVARGGPERETKNKPSSAHTHHTQRQRQGQTAPNSPHTHAHARTRTHAHTRAHIRTHGGLHGCNKHHRGGGFQGGWCRRASGQGLGLCLHSLYLGCEVLCEVKHIGADVR